MKTINTLCSAARPLARSLDILSPSGVLEVSKRCSRIPEMPLRPHDLNSYSPENRRGEIGCIIDDTEFAANSPRQSVVNLLENVNLWRSLESKQLKYDTVIKF